LIAVVVVVTTADEAAKRDGYIMVIAAGAGADSNAVPAVAVKAADGC
jgi:hypothetical protein